MNGSSEFWKYFNSPPVKKTIYSLNLNYNFLALKCAEENLWNSAENTIPELLSQPKLFKENKNFISKICFCYGYLWFFSTAIFNWNITLEPIKQLQQFQSFTKYLVKYLIFKYQYLNIWCHTTLDLYISTCSLLEH